MLIVCAFASHASAQSQWKGNRSSDWGDAKNWNPKGVPDFLTNATIDTNQHGPPIIGSNDTEAANNLIVGDSHTGKFIVDDTGFFTSANVTLGSAAGGSGTITVDRSTLFNRGGLTIGNAGTGTLDINSGARVSSQFGTMAQTSGSHGTVTVNGTNSQWNISNALVIGFIGQASVTVSNGGIINTNIRSNGAPDGLVIGQNGAANGSVTVTGSDSTVANSGNLIVGKAGTGTLTISGDSSVSSSSNVSVASQAGSTGTINIGAPSGSDAAAPGVIDAASIVMGSGTAKINFNHTSNGFSFNNPITGNGSVNILAGTTIFTGDSTYAGTTTISSGATLQLGGSLGDNNSGSIVSNVTDNSTLIVARSNTSTLPGVISGSGQVLQLGAGTTVLANNNNYTGGTTISAGTLVLGNNNTKGSAGTGAIVDNSILAVNRIDVFSLENIISGNGQLQQIGPGITALKADNTFTGVTTITAGTLQLGVNGTTGSVVGTITDNSVFAVLRTNSLTLSKAISGTGQFQQLGAGLTIFTADNTYAGGTTISAGTLQLGNGGTTGSLIGNITDNGGLTVNRSNTVTLPGVISGNGVLNQIYVGTTILTADNIYSGRTTISAGTLQLGDGHNTGAVVGAITDNAILAINHSNMVTLPGVITGNGQLRQIGAGTTILTGDNSYAGMTTITAGTLQLGNGGASGAVGPGADVDNSALTVNRSTSLTLSNAISGTGQFTQAGAGTTIFTADNSYASGTTISAGTLQLGNGSTTGSVIGTITDSGILAINHSNSFTQSNFVSGTGQLQQMGASTTVVIADETFSGLTTISAGTLQLGIGGTAGSVLGNIRDDSLLIGNHTDVLTIPGVISGTGAFTQLGTGTIFTADNSYSGSTTIAAGVLQLGDGGTAGAVAGAIIDNNILAINRSNAATLPGAISGSGQLKQIGTGTTILAGDNSYSGTTTISAGTLQLGNGGATGSLGTGAVVDDSVIAVNRSNVYTIGNTIGGSGQFNQIGVGTTILTATNTSFRAHDHFGRHSAARQWGRDRVLCRSDYRQ